VTQDAAADQPATRAEDRRVFSLSTGSRICFIVAALLLLLAGYLFWSPLGASVANGFPAKCGSAAHPPSDTLGKAVCGSVNDERRAQALAALGAAVIVAGGGLLAFGAAPVASRRRSSATE
jgi:hypothetical protein